MTDPIVTDPVESTPEPVVKAAAVWGTLSALILTLLGVGVAVGVLTSEQASAITDVVNYVTSNLVTVGTVLVGLFTLVSGIVSSHVTAAVARRQVAPVAKSVRR